MKNSLKGNLLLTLTALIWGFAFVAQSVGMDYVGPFTFQCLRSVLGVIVLLPLIFRRSGKTGYSNKVLVRKGLVIGVIFFIASSLQQVGVVYTTAGKAGFITAMYIIFVPLLKMFGGNRVSVKMWISVVLAISGLYFLCMNESFSISRGDFLCLLCALFFALHIIAIDNLGTDLDGVRISAIQFGVNAVLSSFVMFLYETPSIAAIQGASLSIAYAGIMSSGVAYTLQIIGQRYTSPVMASLIMSLESVFAVIGGVLLLHEVIGVREFIGIALMFSSIIISQFSES